MFVMDNSLSADDLKAFAAQIAANEKTVGALFSQQNGTISYALCRAKDAACDLRALSQDLNKALHGKGGGNQELCCGKLPEHSQEEIRQTIKTFSL